MFLFPFSVQNFGDVALFNSTSVSPFTHS